MINIKKYFQYLGLLGICCLSFYYTERVALYVKNMNPLMQEIKDVSKIKNISPVNSIIYDNTYIIPGLEGQEINLDKSFYQMNKNNTYSDSALVFNFIKPTISLETNKDKIIIRGNKDKNSVSLIFEKISNLTRYLHQQDYLVNLLINEEEYNSNYELINNSNLKKTYQNIEEYLNKNNLNKNLCLVKNNKISNLCKDKYLFKPSLIITHSNISTNLNKIKSGEIILVKDSLSLSELNLLLNQIKYQGLNIIPLSELINESR